MSDELEQKRKEKIESFKIHFDDDFDDISSVTPEETPQDDPKDYSIDLHSESAPEEEKSFYEITDVPEEENISSYSGEPPVEEPMPNKKEYRAAKRADRKRRRRKAKRNRVIFRTIWMAMIVFVSIMIGEFIMDCFNDLVAVGREEDKSVMITIPKDATLDQITEILKTNGVIRNDKFFKLYATVTKATSGFTQGTFDIKTNKDYQALINYLQSDINRTDVVTLQFREGITVNELAEMLEEGKVCTSESFLEKCNSTEFDEDYDFLLKIKNSSVRYYRLEGYLFPDTYDFYVGEDPSSVVRKLLSNYRRKMYFTKIRFEKNGKKQTVEERAEQLGMSMDDVINVASLIQAEAANADDMYMVSSVLHNRLDTLENGGVNDYGEGGLSLLQLDSTVFYPYKSKQQVPISIRSSYESRYSTYKYEGLPTGPICNPGLQAIQAALTPADTDYYYFCHKAATADTPAEAYYARTNDEHIANLEEAGLL